jgi:hypothetical protein
MTDIEHAEALALDAEAHSDDIEEWHMKSDRLWLFVLKQIQANSTDPTSRQLAEIALRPRSDTDGWYA